MNQQIIRWMALFAFTLLAVIIVIPSLIVNKHPVSSTIPSVAANSNAENTDKVNQSALTNQEAGMKVTIYLAEKKTIESVPLETYVRGVVAAEMPSEFQLEALKAQAVAARTYIVRRMVENDHSNVPVPGAWVTDTVANQAYLSEHKLAQWINEAERAGTTDKWDKLNEAVNATKGVIITYDHKPINAVFFSSSNGYTVNSEDYWGIYVPYLRSVSSPWDAKLAPGYKQTVRYSYSDVLQKLNIDNIITASTKSSGFHLIATTSGHQIKKLSVNGVILSGKEVRERLGLRSTQFTWARHGSTIDFTTTGSGHGVGMSQWGAEGMALQGAAYEQILAHYYTGIQLENVNKFL